MNDGFTGRFSPRFSTSNFGSVVSRRSLQYDNLSEIPTFNLLKLHGSVGWKTTEDSSDDASRAIRFDPSLDELKSVADKLSAARSLLLPMSDETSAESLLDDVPLDVDMSPVQEFVDAYESLSVVNPTKEKFKQTVLNQNYYDLLRIFSNDLEKENSVLFAIGFSCRDEHIRDLMIRAARTNPTLQIFVFAYSNDEHASIEARFDGQITNGNLRVVAPPPPAESDEERTFYSMRVITDSFFAPLVPRPPRQPDATVDVRVALQQPLVPDGR